jgi:hypothetical protein
MAGIPSISIFISSPGDVFEERTLAQRVIERLQSEYAGRAVLEPIFWEHEPLVATADFQTQIAQPSTSDIMVGMAVATIRVPSTSSKTLSTPLRKRASRNCSSTRKQQRLRSVWMTPMP